MTSTFFTSDHHFGHANIIRFSKRPFADVHEMDEALIANWNAVVKPTDDVWHLGDFNFHGHPTPHYLGRLHGRIHLVLGNHDDKYAAKHRHLFASVQEVRYLRLHNEKIFLSHYAHRVWRNSHHGSWHLFGHSHGMLPKDWGKSLDVGVDAQAYRPIHFDDVAAYMKDQPITHHHPEA